MERSDEAIKYRHEIYEQFARIGKAVSSPVRLELLELLSHSPRTVEALAKALGQSVANTSQHLQTLKNNRLVKTSKDGLYVHYQLADDCVITFIVALKELAEARLAEVKQTTAEFLKNREFLKEIDRDQLTAKLNKNNVMVLDLRSQKEYQNGHIPGAISIPANELESKLALLPEGKEIVAYCRGPYCVFGIEAVEMMRSKGIKAYRLKDGVPEWIASGNKVETGQ